MMMMMMLMLTCILENKRSTKRQKVVERGGDIDRVEEHDARIVAL
jgi:hypothetical protein